MSANTACYTIVHDDLVEGATSPELRNALQKGSDEVKLETMRRIIVGTLNGQSHVSEAILWRYADDVACPTHAHHPICHAFEEQADQEDAAFLLGVSLQTRIRG